MHIMTGQPALRSSIREGAAVLRKKAQQPPRLTPSPTDRLHAVRLPSGNGTAAALPADNGTGFPRQRSRHGAAFFVQPSRPVPFVQGIPSVNGGKARRIATEATGRMIDAGGLRTPAGHASGAASIWSRR